MIANLITTVKAECPACETGKFILGHEPGNYGPWGCDHCGANYRFVIGLDYVEMFQETVSDIPTWLITKIRGSEPPVYIITSSFLYVHSRGQTPEEMRESRQFFVEEHTCPVNIIRVDAIVSDGDADPHGVLEFVAEIPKAEGWENGDTDALGILAEAGVFGDVIEGSVKASRIWLNTPTPTNNLTGD